MQWALNRIETFCAHGCCMCVIASSSSSACSSDMGQRERCRKHTWQQSHHHTGMLCCCLVMAGFRILLVWALSLFGFTEVEVTGAPLCGFIFLTSLCGLLPLVGRVSNVQGRQIQVFRHVYTFIPFSLAPGHMQGPLRHFLFFQMPAHQ